MVRGQFVKPRSELDPDAHLLRASAHSSHEFRIPERNNMGLLPHPDLKLSGLGQESRSISGPRFSNSPCPNIGLRILDCGKYA